MRFTYYSGGDLLGRLSITVHVCARFSAACEYRSASAESRAFLAKLVNLVIAAVTSIEVLVVVIGFYRLIGLMSNVH